MAEINSKENIERGIAKAVKGKTHRGYARELLNRKSYYVSLVQQILSDGSYKCGKAHHATRIEGGKIRHLTYTDDPVDIAVRFSVTLFFADILIPKMLPGICANIEGRGTLYCISMAKENIQKKGYKYYLCEDVHKYFASVDVPTLLRILHEESGCGERELEVVREMLRLCENGVAIGTYDAQLWANVYLMQFDRYIAVRYPHLGYLRYCDNITVFGNDIMELHKVHQDISNFMRCLKLRTNPCLFGATKDGCRVLSAVIFPTHTRLRRRVKEAMRRSNNTPSYFGHCKYVDSHHLIRKIMYKKFGDFIDIPEYVISFTGDKKELGQLVGKKLIVTDCLIEPGKFTRKDGEPRERAKVAFQMEDGRDYVVFSSSQQIIHYCRHFLSDKSRYLPVCLMIIKNNKQYQFAEYVEQD